MITVASLLWDANKHSQPFSSMYDESWVVRLYEGFRRNLTVPFRFVLFTDRERDLPTEIQQETLRTPEPDYGCCVEPFRFGTRMIIVGLDTVITGNIDHLAAYCDTSRIIALPRDPFAPGRACNGVALVPDGQQCIYRNWDGENDMEWLRQQPHLFIDDLFPGHVVSYKGNVRQRGLGDARIVYFHGQEKPHQLMGVDWIEKHWKAAA